MRCVLFHILFFILFIFLMFFFFFRLWKSTTNLKMALRRCLLQQWMSMEFRIHYVCIYFVYNIVHCFFDLVGNEIWLGRVVVLIIITYYGENVFLMRLLSLLIIIKLVFLIRYLDVWKNGRFALSESIMI